MPNYNLYNCVVLTSGSFDTLHNVFALHIMFFGKKKSFNYVLDTQHTASVLPVSLIHASSRGKRVVVSAVVFPVYLCGR